MIGGRASRRARGDHHRVHCVHCGHPLVAVGDLPSGFVPIPTPGHLDATPSLACRSCRVGYVSDAGQWVEVCAFDLG